VSRDPNDPDEPAAVLRSAWQAGGPATPAETRLVEEMLGADPGFAQGSAALVPEEAIAMAVLGGHNQAIHADPLFAEWFPDPGALPDLRRIASKARAAGSALGLLETHDGAPVAAWVACGPIAGKWARSDAARGALGATNAVLVLVFAPSRSGDLAARAADAFGLTPLESRLAEAFLFAPTLEIAAAQTGIGRATARDALTRIMARTGARRSADIVGRMSGLMSAVHDEPEPSAHLLAEAFGLTPAEAGVALRLAAGDTQREGAAALGLQPETVRSYAKAVLAKTGVERAKDLTRLAAETRALSSLVAVAEPVFVSGAQPARLRLMPRPQDRRLAFLDYGPRSGRPAIIFHGFVAGRSLPPRLASALHAAGLRPIVPQRPGFGLTSPAASDYLTEAAEDLEALVAALGSPRIALFARDGGTAAALGFAAAHPDRISHAVLLNPRSPSGLSPLHRGGPVAQMTRLVLERPQVIEGLADLIRRRTRSDYLAVALRQTLSAIPEDRATLEDPAVRAQLIRDIQAQFAHTSAGYAAEQALYAKGWRVPRVRGGPWAIVHAGALGPEPSREAWLSLPDVTFHVFRGAGVLTQFTHAEALARLIAGAPVQASGKP
jgi:pimeloyl-ACP methyl ester carboxylesterase/DNA-binding CsgD family transcriptional regulator